jgi:hypothetical protein
MTEQERFFWQHAGYSYDPKTETRATGRTRCARSLADAETWAESVGMTFEWEWDESPDLSWMTESEQAEEHEVLVCIARYRDGEIAGSLGDPDPTYRRVVEAELASEAKHDCLASLEEAI